MAFVRLMVLLLLVAYSWAMGQTPPAGLNAFGKLVSSLFFILAPALYLLPTYEAWKRDHPSLTSIALVNLFLGWSLIGWVVAFAWACKSQEQKVVVTQAVAEPPGSPGSPGALSTSDELRKLVALRDDGLVTEAEFQAQRAKLLSS